MTNPKRIAVGYVVGAVISAYLCSGMFFSERTYFWGSESAYAYKHRRHVLGESILMGCLVSIGWPIGLPISWLTTGFAEHGIWQDHIRFPPPREEQ